MDLKETYNRIAEDWHKDHQKDDWWTGGTDAFAVFLHPGNLVLDVGCGSGIKSDYLIKKGLQVVGIDFSEKMIEIAQREVPAGEFYALDLRTIGTLGRAFDGIFMQASLLHIPRNEAEGVLRLMAAQLKSGGYLYVAVKDKEPGRQDEAIEKEADYGYSYERFFSYFTLDEIREYMRSIGCAVRYEAVATAPSCWIQVIGQKVARHADLS